MPKHSIELSLDDEDGPGEIADEIQLEKFIQVLQTAQVLAQEKEKGEMTKRRKVYTKNAPRTKRRWRRAQDEYQAAGGKLITNWFERKEVNEDAEREIDHPGVGTEAEGTEMCPAEECQGHSTLDAPSELKTRKSS